jgi:methionine-gamma-lyase
MTQPAHGENHGFATRAIHAGERADPSTGAHNTPIYQTTTYAFDSLEAKASAMSGEPGSYIYTRGGNPTTAALEAKIAALEGAEAAVAGASGMAVIMAALRSLARAGDHIVAAENVYFWANIYLDEDAPLDGVAVSRVDITDLDAVRAAMRPNTKVLYTEFLSNPAINVADIPALAAIARERGATLVVDNTFTSPYLFRPLEHGAHLSLHSATKYISGHGDALAGVISGDAALIAPILRQIEILGSCISPFNAWLLLRGVKTLDLRMERHCTNALELARFLERQPEVSEVRYAGLESHPGHAIARDLTGGRYGGMLSFRLHSEGCDEQAERLADALQLCAHAVSLGDVSTLVWPHRSNVYGELVRVSVGCEDIRDIIADFEQAFEAVGATT